MITSIHTPSQNNGSLSQEQLRHYNEEGYLVLEDLLNEDDLRPVVESLQEKVDEIARALSASGLIEDLHEDASFDSRLALLFKGRSDEEFLKYGRSWRDRRPGYFDIMSNPKILDAVESLIGGEIFANPVYNVRPKVPGVAAGAVPWHQDKSYWPGANANPVITVWIPLVDATPLNGCLKIWPRTHKKRVLPYHTENRTGTGYTEIDAECLRDADRRAIQIPVRAGSPILFNDRCLHMSTANNAETVRWSLDLRYQPTDQDPMPQHGIGFLARSRKHPEQVSTCQQWLEATNAL